MGWSLTDIESRLPWEREVYIHLHREELKRQEQAQQS